MCAVPLRLTNRTRTRTFAVPFGTDTVFEKLVQSLVTVLKLAIDGAAVVPTTGSQGLEVEHQVHRRGREDVHRAG